MCVVCCLAYVVYWCVFVVVVSCWLWLVVRWLLFGVICPMRVACCFFLGVSYGMIVVRSVLLFVVGCVLSLVIVCCALVVMSSLLLVIGCWSCVVS